jgi:hypothetical protein
MIWRGNGRLILTLACVTLWLALPLPAAAEMRANPAQVDSLVWYVEQLEHDLTMCQIRAGARADSLAIRLDFTTERLKWAEEDRRRWYHDPRLWFLAGCAAATVVMSGAIAISF